MRVQQRARAKQAVQSKRTNEQCEQMSEQTSERPSTYVSILVCSRPQCDGATKEDNDDDGATKEDEDDDGANKADEDDGGAIKADEDDDDGATKDGDDDPKDEDDDAEDSLLGRRTPTMGVGRGSFNFLPSREKRVFCAFT